MSDATEPRSTPLILIDAALEFAHDEEKRKARPRFTSEQRAELARELTAVTGLEGLSRVDQAAQRGDLAVRISGYRDDYSESAANVIADIMHAVAATGGDPLAVVAHARSYYYQEAPEEGQ